MVSVVIPVYNVEECLDRCIESVLKLKTDFEIILVDDGSKDNSGAICDTWAQRDARVKVIHQKNGGLSAARNTGILACEGEYILFLDSDDFLNPVETDIMLCAQSTGADSIIGLYQAYYAQDERYEKESCDALLQMKGLVDINHFLQGIPRDGRSCYMVAPRFVVRKDILLENRLFFFAGIYHEDEEWTHRLLATITNIYVSHNFFYQYRQAREGSITSSVKPKHIQDRFIIMERAEKLIHNKNLSDEKKVYLKNRLAQLYLNNMIDWRVLDKNGRKQTCHKLKYFQKSCSECLSGYIGWTVRICQMLFGISITCHLLALVRKLLKG